MTAYFGILFSTLIYSFQTQHDLIVFNNLFDDNRLVEGIYSQDQMIFCMKRPCEKEVKKRDESEEQDCPEITQNAITVVSKGATAGI